MRRHRVPFSRQNILSHARNVSSIEKPRNKISDNEDKQEIPIENFVADIYNNGQIIEIQTGQFSRMREKLKTFLPLYPVTIVYPIPREKWLIWIDEESGEASPKRKSPAKNRQISSFPWRAIRI